MTHLSEAERRRLLRQLAAERERTAERAAALERSFDDIVSASAESVRDDEHDPEGATIAFERAQVAALLADARARIDALDAAAGRLTEPTAGACERCGLAIGFERLLARPSTTLCVRCATAA